MIRAALVVPLVVVAFALLPSAALSKGASEAEITGPGLDRPISLAGEGPAGGEQLMRIADAAGFFPAVFAQSPDPMLGDRPAGNLGPRFVIEYVMPGPNGADSRIAQDVYPYAQPRPVTYTTPGQRFWTTERTRGGWFVATSALREYLVGAGLPADPPVSSGNERSHWRLVGGAVAVAAIVAAVARAVLAITRRLDAATT